MLLWKYKEYTFENGEERHGHTTILSLPHHALQLPAHVLKAAGA